MRCIFVTSREIPSETSCITLRSRACIIGNNYMEDCENKSDIDLSQLAKPGSDVYGIVYTLSSISDIDEDGTTGFIKNCHNYGNLKGSNNIMGAIGVINAGWKISDCSNRGDVTASNGSSTAYAYGFSSKTSAGKTKESLVTIERCFNSGEVKGNGAGISGFIGDLAKFGYMSDSQFSSSDPALVS